MCELFPSSIQWIGGLDFSGADAPSLQKKHIFFTFRSMSGDRRLITNGKTRLEWLNHLIHLASTISRHSYAILGMDFSFAFPSGFYESVTGKPWTDFRKLLNLWDDHNLNSFRAREWAGQINSLLAEKLSLPGGPFWGPSFPLQRRKPHFLPMFPFKEKRLCEQWIPRTHSVFQLGGHGSVGLQSLYGMVFIRQLIEGIRQYDITVHIWPNDGAGIPPPPAILILETYPGILNKGPKSDYNDAASILHFLEKTFVFSGEYLHIMKSIKKRVSPRMLKEEGFIYGPPETIFSYRN